MSAYQCFACGKVVPLMDEKMRTTAEQGHCPLCGEGKGQVISKEGLVKGMDAGVFYNIGPDGKPIKKKT